MVDESSKMGVAEGAMLVSITTFVPIFLSSGTVYLEQATTAAWLVSLISAIAAVIMLLILFYVMERVPGDLHTVAENLLGNTGARLVSLYLFVVFFAEAVLLLRQFGENSLLTALPDFDMAVIIAWYVLCSAIAIQIGIESVARAAYVLLPMGVCGCLLLLLLLYDKFYLYNLTPWFGSEAAGIMQASKQYVGSLAPAVLVAILATAFQNQPTVRTAAWLGLGLSTFFRGLALFIYTGVFGVAVGREKVLPFFEMARMVYINRFIQRVEPFFIVIWVAFCIASIAINLYVAAYLLKRLFRLPSLRPLVMPLALIAAELAMLPPTIVSAINLHNQVSATVYVVCLFVLPLILLLALLIKRKGGHRRAV